MSGIDNGMKFLGRGVRAGDVYALSRGATVVDVEVVAMDPLLGQLVVDFDGSRATLGLYVERLFVLAGAPVTLKLTRVQGANARLVFGAPSSVRIDVKLMVKTNGRVVRRRPQTPVDRVPIRLAGRRGADGGNDAA